jgi:putative DNA primase/helicase
LTKYVNVAPDELVLVYVWIIAVFWPSGPYLLLVLIAEQGSGKSTLVRALRRLIDPNKSPFQTLPRDEEALALSAKNRWLVALDNLSNIQPWLSDALCRLSTGGGLNKRKLWTDGDEVIFDVQRPVILNGIADLASRPDLADRALVLRLPRIAEKQRKPEAEFWNAFEQDLPYILGAVFDVICGVLERIDDVKLEELPRMADFARLGVAAEPDLPVPPKAFLDAYLGNRAGLTQAAIEDDAFIGEVAAIARNSGYWEGTATELRNLVLYLWGQDEASDGRVPSSPNAVSSRLRQFLPALRAEGVEVVLDHREPGTGRRLIRIRVVKPE